MAVTIKLKNASGSDPSASDLVVGEVAIRTDNGKLLMCTNSSSAMNIRIPNNSSVAFPVGSEISLVNVLTHASANSLGFVNTAGVTLSSKEASNTVADRYTSATLKKTGTNAWLLIGNLA